MYSTYWQQPLEFLTDVVIEAINLIELNPGLGNEDYQAGGVKKRIKKYTRKSRPVEREKQLYLLETKNLKLS